MIGDCGDLATEAIGIWRALWSVVIRSFRYIQTVYRKCIWKMVITDEGLYLSNVPPSFLLSALLFPVQRQTYLTIFIIQSIFLHICVIIDRLAHTTKTKRSYKHKYVHYYTQITQMKKNKKTLTLHKWHWTDSTCCSVTLDLNRTRTEQEGPLVELENQVCAPRPVVVAVPQPELQGLHFPFYVTLHRCGGACQERPLTTRCIASGKLRPYISSRWWLKSLLEVPGSVRNPLNRPCVKRLHWLGESTSLANELLWLPSVILHIFSQTSSSSMWWFTQSRGARPGRKSATWRRESWLWAW